MSDEIVWIARKDDTAKPRAAGRCRRDEIPDDCEEVTGRELKAIEKAIASLPAVGDTPADTAG